MSVKFAVVQSWEQNQLVLSVMPAHWVVAGGWNGGKKDADSNLMGDDLMYWPNRNNTKMFIKAEKHIHVLLSSTTCNKIRCRIKRENINSRAEAEAAIKKMEHTLDTDGKATPRPPVSNRMTNSHSKLMERAREFHQGKAQSATPEQSPEHGCAEFSSASGQCQKCEVYNDVKSELAALKEIVIHGFAQLSTKLHAIGEVAFSQPISTNANVTLPSAFPFKPVKSENELRDLEDAAKDVTYVRQVVKASQSIYAKNSCFGKGRSVALNMADKFFDRNFVLKCTWTGRAAMGTKIRMQNYPNVMNLFHAVILSADSTWSTNSNEKFFKSIIDNSGKRAKAGEPQRETAAREHKKKVYMKVKLKKERKREETQLL